VEDWEDKPEEDHTVANMMAHFTRADDNRRDREQGMKGVLKANGAILNGADMHGPTEPIRYCWSHGICGHTSTKCTQPADGHVKTATFANLKAHGGNWFIQKPKGFKPVYKHKPINNPRRGDKKDKEGTPTNA
jgi:hypothetical protein